LTIQDLVLCRTISGARSIRVASDQARIAGVLVAQAQVASQRQAHMVRERAALPACGAAALPAASLALGLDVVVEALRLELRERGVGCQQQRNGEPGRVRIHLTAPGNSRRSA
jgi:hypothetical protein